MRKRPQTPDAGSTLNRGRSITARPSRIRCPDCAQAAPIPGSTMHPRHSNPATPPGGPFDPEAAPSLDLDDYDAHPKPTPLGEGWPGDELYGTME
ncbi:hypothetical protein GCM10025780_28520 [Frondihabitans cladoniiphilus]|uniref:Uncharacterized protein n=2 Tax=Frondihabitans cladoniiphilus TaxID=715785 RepID=A0ABP8W671_9MICO